MSKASFSLVQGDPSEWGAPSEGKTYLGINTAGQLVLKQSDGTITPLIVGGTPSLHKQTSASGIVTVSPSTPVHTEVVTLAGSARAVPVQISEDNSPADGARVFLKFIFPAIASLDISIYSGDSTLLATFSTDGVVLTGTWELYCDNGVWAIQLAQVPAYN